ncbi:putative cytochrome P450 [Leptodontidium sp. 2 PMI_412]|nr:putative cytochrome P450 [Leptodontidium sp. 2 PMI_412]
MINLLISADWVSVQTVIQGALFGLLLWASSLLCCGFCGPLAKIPGPWYARFTDLWLKKYTVTGRRLHYIHALHKEYGSVVRIGPNEVDISDLEAFQEIHKIGNGYLKDPWYQRFRTGKTQDVFSVIDPKQHAAKRKLLARPFSNTSLRQNWESLVIDKVKLVVAKIKADAQQGSADLNKWWVYMATDIIGKLAFGEDFGMVESGRRTPFIEDFESVAKINGIRAEFTLLYDFLNTITLGLFNPVEATDARIQQYTSRVIVNARDRTLQKANIFQGMLEKSEMSDYAACFEATGLLAAGSGTTAITLVYLVWAVLRNTEVQKKLEQEVASLPDEFRDVDLEALPYLNAVIQEALRLYGAAPGSLPRVVPKGNGLNVGSYNIPPGTTICTQAYTIHRNPVTFGSPETFHPDRFLESQNLPIGQKSVLCAFGAGSRTCLGMHLAYMELRHAVACFFRECVGARLSESTTDESMQIEHFFLISPKARKCEITLLPQALCVS